MWAPVLPTKKNVQKIFLQKSSYKQTHIHSTHTQTNKQSQTSKLIAIVCTNPRRVSVSGTLSMQCADGFIGVFVAHVNQPYYIFHNRTHLFCWIFRLFSVYFFYFWRRKKIIFVKNQNVIHKCFQKPYT